MEKAVFVIYSLAILLTLYFVIKSKNKSINYYSVIFIASFVLIFTPLATFGLILFSIASLFAYLYLMGNSEKTSGKLIHSFIFLPILADIALNMSGFQYANYFSAILITSISGFAWLIYDRKPYKEYIAVYFIPAAYVICAILNIWS